MPEYSDQEIKDLEQMTNIADIQDKIDKARKWALDHFNAKEAGNPDLIDYETSELMKPSAFVTFPEPDKMTVIPFFKGKPIGIHYHFRLWFNKDSSTEWRGNHPVYRTPMPPLKVT